MPIVYTDESIQESVGFIVASYLVCPESIDTEVRAALSACGLNPDHDEFHSGLRMNGHCTWQDVRDALFGIIGMARVGFLIVPISERVSLGRHALNGLVALIERGYIDSENLRYIVDSGFFRSAARGQAEINSIPALGQVAFFPEADGRRFGGLQAADLVAHTIGQILRAKVTGRSKIIQLGEEDGYERGTDAELDWCMTMGFRYNFLGKFSEHPTDTIDEYQPWLEVRHQGVYEAGELPEGVADALEACFGRVWLGCIH